MSVHVETIPSTTTVLLLRHKDGEFRFGSAPDFRCVALLDDTFHAHLVMAGGRIGDTCRTEVFRALMQHGALTMDWERSRGGFLVPRGPFRLRGIND